VKRAGASFAWPSFVIPNTSKPANTTAVSDSTNVEYSSIVIFRGVFVLMA